MEDIRNHFDLLVHDVHQIESGFLAYPSINFYPDTGDEGCSRKNTQPRQGTTDPRHSNKGSRSDQERRKGVPWTEDEHRLFLLGLEKYGKGDWRSISRNYVVTRTPTQVASHAQKYFIRLNSMNRDRRRSSIHDITNVGTAPNRPITGQCQSNGSGGPYTPNFSKQAPALQPVQQPLRICGPQGQPIRGPPLASLENHVGFPVISHMQYNEVPSGLVLLPPGPVMNVGSSAGPSRR